MNDIYFSMYDLQLIPRACLNAQNSVQESVSRLAKTAGQLKQEVADFDKYARAAVQKIRKQIAETAALMTQLDQKIAAAQGKIQQELSHPQKPAFPEHATQNEINSIAAAYHAQVSAVDEKNAAIQKNNQRIREYVAHCKEAKAQLEKAVSDLRQLEISAQKETEALSATAKEALNQLMEAYGQSLSAPTAMDEFYSVFNRIVEAAEKLYGEEPRSIRQYSDIDKQFSVRNTHRHYAPSPAFAPLSGEAQETDPISAPPAEDSCPEEEELVVKEKDADAFLRTIRGANRVRMPSAHLHKLGGKAFTAKMAEAGYTNIIQPDGSLIDRNGMIHWEKKG